MDSHVSGHSRSPLSLSTKWRSANVRAAEVAGVDAAVPLRRRVAQIQQRHRHVRRAFGEQRIDHGAFALPAVYPE
jgi:hypothetical protein